MCSQKATIRRMCRKAAWQLCSRASKKMVCPVGISRSTIKRKRDQALPEDLFVTETVGPAKEEVCIVHPIRLLQFMIQTIPAVEQLMEAILRDSDWGG